MVAARTDARHLLSFLLLLGCGFGNSPRFFVNRGKNMVMHEVQQADFVDLLRGAVEENSQARVARKRPYGQLRSRPCDVREASAMRDSPGWSPAMSFSSPSALTPPRRHNGRRR